MMRHVRFVTLAASAVIALGVAVGCGGSDGKDGINGASGVDGANGQDGVNGATGPAGSNGVTGPAGSDGATGPAGSDGATGPAGSDGATGATGGSGTTGPAGVNGGNVRITDFHGLPYLESSGEFANGAKSYVNAKIDAATADDTGKVTVNFTVTDTANKPVLGLTAVQANIAKLVPPGTGEGNSKWVPYIQALQTVSGSATGNWPNPDGTKACQGSRENNGTLTEVGNGQYTYEFKNNLTTVTCDGTPTTTYTAADRALTHRVSIMMGGHAGATADAYLDFVPDGTAVAVTRNIVSTDACRSCHGPMFAGHGGDRLTVENCVTCHTQGGIDPQGGESIDMTTMIHRIHMGNELPTVAGPDGIFYDDPATPANEAADNGEYSIWGHGNTKMTFEAGFPAVISNCTKCHTGTTAQVDNWKAAPTRKACGSCHDTIDWVAGTNHSGGAQANDAYCQGCHDATTIVDNHDWTTKDVRNIPEFTLGLTVSTPANGKYFVKGERPIFTMVVKRNGTAIDHTTFNEDAANDGCTLASCPQGDGLFRASNLYVAGPRANRQAVLTYGARAKAFASSVGPFDLSTATSLIVKVDNGQDVTVFDDQGGDSKASSLITVAVPATGAFADKANATAAEVVAWLNNNAAFQARAIAYLDEHNGKPAIRSRALGKLHSIQVMASTAGVALFGLAAGADGAINIAGSGATMAKRTNPANQDPMVTYTTANVSYKMDPVDDLAPGTYVVDVQISDIGNNTSTVPGDYRTPSVGWVTFQVGQETAEKMPANNCNSCHQSEGGKGFVLDYPRHNKQFSDDAVDHCSACHDYAPGTATGTAFSGGGIPIVKRVHSVHMGAGLNYPNATVAHEDGTPGRNWQINYPMDIRNCESCHTSATSGTWMTNASRLACGSCHDSDAATAHIALQTYDPTPANAWSGDEQESCQACH